MPYIELLIPVFFCLFVTLLLPRVGTLAGTVSTCILLMAYLVGYHAWSPAFKFRFETVLPIFILIVGYAGVMAHHFFASKKETQKTMSDPEGSDKMLGLFYQQQGMLDLAFEKFRSLPLQGDIKDLICDLAVEYERQGQLNKALAAYKWIAGVGEEKKDESSLVHRSDITEFDAGVEPQTRGRLTDLSRIHSGAAIGKYIVSEETSRDAKGAVFRGRDSSTETCVIIRIFSISGVEDSKRSDIRNRFFRDVGVLSQMSHTNIASLYDYGEEHDLLYIVSEDLEAEAMTRHTQKGMLFPIKEALRIISCAADALAYAHGNKVVHQCLRPAAIIRMKHSKEVKVKDFETSLITSLFQPDMDASDDSYSYLSPEQIAGKRVDFRSDIFSLGSILFEMLTGARPFSGEDMTRILLNISKEKHPSPRFFDPKIPRVVEKIIDRALEKDLENRYQNAGQLAAHLNQVITRINELTRKKVNLEPLNHAKA